MVMLRCITGIDGQTVTAVPDVQKQMEHQYHLPREKATTMLQAHEAAVAELATRLRRPDGSNRRAPANSPWVGDRPLTLEQQEPDRKHDV